MTELSTETLIGGRLPAFRSAIFNGAKIAKTPKTMQAHFGGSKEAVLEPLKFLNNNYLILQNKFLLPPSFQDKPRAQTGALKSAF